MAYKYRPKPVTDIALEEEAHTRAKFDYFRKAESSIDLGPAVIEWRPAPLRYRGKRAECGTNSGYRTHITNQTTPCQACKVARAVYQREYRASKKAA